MNLAVVERAVIWTRTMFDVFDEIDARRSGATLHSQDGFGVRGTGVCSSDTLSIDGGGMGCSSVAQLVGERSNACLEMLDVLVHPHARWSRGHRAHRVVDGR